MVYGGRLGGAWGATPLLAWTGLFGALGWNFLDYGLFNPPPEAGGIIWGWVICGVMFEAMAFGPLLVAIPAIRSSRLGGGGRAVMPSPSGYPVPANRSASVEKRAVLRDIATDMGSVVTAAAAITPADPLARAVTAEEPAAGTGADFAEGTQALLDRLERLGDMRDRGLLSVEEFEAAKAPIVAELEARA